MRAWLLRSLRLVVYTIINFLRNRSLDRSSALSYVTILSLVPILALSFALLKGVGAYDSWVQSAVEPALEQVFGPSVEEVTGEADRSTLLRTAVDNLLDLAEQIHVWSLGLVGLGLLLYVVMNLLGSVEDTFNRIWGVRKGRSFKRKVTDYLTLIIIAPLCILAATAITAAAQNNAVVDWLRERLHLGPAVDMLFKFVPLLSVWAAFSLLYLIMPNRRVKVSSALLGGVLAGTLWQIVQVYHMQIQVGVARYNAIYSGFAAIPIFLVWVYLSWSLILFGAEFSFAHQNGPMVRPLELAAQPDWVFKWRLAMSASLVASEAFLRGKDPPTSDVMGRRLQVQQRHLRDVLWTLVDKGVLIHSQQGRAVVFLPARSPERITVRSILEALGGQLDPAVVESQGPMETRVDEAITQWLSSLAGTGLDTSLADLIDAMGPAQSEDDAMGPAEGDDDG